MSKKIIFILCVGLALAGLPGSSTAGVDVSIGINVPPPPPFLFPVPPPVVVIPNTYAYFAPDADIDIVFYHGYWYRPHEDRWFRAKSYNGPWHYLERHRIPRHIIQLPPDFRRSYYDRPRIPYGHMHKNWNRWERDKYWDKRHWKHDEREWKEERRERRHDRIERHKEAKERFKEEKREHKRQNRGRHND